MTTWANRIALFVLLFGFSPLAFGGYGDNAAVSLLLNALGNLAPIFSTILFCATYRQLPGLYKIIAWVLVLGIILLVLESKYEYNQYVYSYFVIKRFAYCGMALGAYCVMRQAQPPTIKWVANFVLICLFVDQILLGHIFSYAFNSDTRTTLSPDAYYLIIPFLYYLVSYLKEHRSSHLYVTLLTFLIIVFLLHRTVISSAVVAAGLVIGLAILGKVTADRLPAGRTILLFGLLFMLALPFVGLLPEKKVDAVMESLGGILSPKEDNTGSWRVEQAQYYMSKFPERPFFGWRYEGYDRGEYMENEDFEEKGTIIHSQYIDMLFNYGVFGLVLQVIMILGTLVALFRAGRVLSTDQLVLFGYVASGLVYSVSYQLPINYWGFVGVGLYIALNQRLTYFTAPEPLDEAVYYDVSPNVQLTKNHTYL